MKWVTIYVLDVWVKTSKGGSYIAVPTVTVEYDDGHIVHVWYMNPNKDPIVVIDVLEYMDIYEIRRVIGTDNKTAVQLIIDGYLSEKDYEPKGESMSEVAEPENGEEETENGEEATESEENGEGEESEATK